MKKSILPFFGIVMLALGANAQNKLELTAQMPELTDGDKVFLWNAVDQSSDSTVVKNKSFSFSRIMKDGGSSFVLQAGKNPETTGLGLVFYLEAGKLHIQGNGGGFKTAKYSGDAFVSEWVAMEKAMTETYKDVSNLDALNLTLGEALMVGDDAVINAITPQTEKLAAKIKASCKQWIDAHLNSGASAYLLNTVLGTLLSRDEMLDYLNKFTGNARNQLTTATLAALTGTAVKDWVGKQAPEFSLPDKNGKTMRLSDFKGKYILIDVWASWCAPCRIEIPQLKAVYEKFKDKNFDIVSVSLDTDKDKWLGALAEEKMPWLHLSDLKGNQGDIVKAYKLKSVPAKFLIDPNGKILEVGFLNTEKNDKVLEDYLNTLFNK